MARKGGLLTSRGTKLALTPASLGMSGSVDTAKMAFGPSRTRKGGKGRKGRKGRGRKTLRRLTGRKGGNIPCEDWKEQGYESKGECLRDQR
jgi:hypothetical protein